MPFQLSTQHESLHNLKLLRWAPLRAGISAGVIAGMLGLGGGLVLAPLMLELGVDPAVSAASTQVRLQLGFRVKGLTWGEQSRTGGLV